MSYQPDHYQQAFITAVGDSDGPNLIAEALAGSGKSSTIEAAARIVGKDTQTLILAFNKSTADSMTGRFSGAGFPRVRARTFNALGHGACADNLPSIQLDRFKSGTIMRELGIKFKERQDQRTVEQLVGLAKSTTWEPEQIPWSQLSTHMGFAVGNAELEAQIHEAAKAVFHHSIDIAMSKGIIDFNDQLYLPVLKRWAMPRTPFVFVDESQDLSDVQIAMLGRVTGRRLFCVGDINQAIYGFRGANAAAIARLTDTFKLAAYPLSICYRCDREIIAHVQRLVPGIEARPGAGEGEIVDYRGTETLLRVKDFPADCMIICRMNAPLFGLAATFINKNIPFQIKGEGISEVLSSYISRIRSHQGWDSRSDVPLAKFMPVAEAWFEAEEARYEQMGHFGLADSLGDYRSILGYISRVEGVKTLSDIGKVLDRILAGKTGPMLSSIHRAKGLEAPTVYILEPQLLPSPRAKEQWAIQQERNLMYVAETRAQHVLVYLPRVNIEE